MKKAFAYSPAWKNQNKTELFGFWDIMTAKQPSVGWIFIPSVQERISQLYKYIPSGHPMKGTIFKMKEDLAIEVSLEGVNVAYLSFITAFDFYRRLLRVQIMHATVLNHVIHSNPMEQKSVIDLDHYMGDVLCVAYLINQTTLNQVDGGPSNGAFFCDTHPSNVQKSCYLSWVHLHSRILRVKSFTSVQRHRLGLPEFSGLSEIVPDNHYVNEDFLSSQLTLVFREFGPLGPAFRGRDIVRFREIPARCLFAYMVGNDTRAPGPIAVNALEWLFEVHEQSRKVRPMTVRPPQVRLAVPA
jgi:hypothetical protein